MREWTIIGSCVAITVTAAVTFPIAAEYAAKGSYGEWIEKERVNILANRDPDKITFIYGCLGWPGGQISNWRAKYGDNAKLVSDENGIKTYEVERWMATPGPDVVQQRVTFQIQNEQVLRYRIDRVAGATDWCDPR